VPNGPRLLAFAGATREGSWNKKLITVALGVAAEIGAQTTRIDLRDFPMPLYDGDLEDREGIPANGQKFKELLIAHQGILLASPEYNSSISGVLKNAIDWASRRLPEEQPLAAFRGKVAGLLSASPGALGGMRALVAVRSLLGNIGMIVVPTQFSLIKADQAFDEAGALKDPAQLVSVRRVVEQTWKVTTALFPAG
jgi:chromate reductase, NAD(P)H dehydrogenase (quinone)